MTEKRKSKRINVDMKLKISDLFKQDNIKIEDIDALAEKKQKEVMSI